MENAASDVLEALQACAAEFPNDYFLELQGQLAQLFSAKDFAQFRSAIAPLLDTRQNLDPEFQQNNPEEAQHALDLFSRVIESAQKFVSEYDQNTSQEEEYTSGPQMLG
jgi:hypothetical protein